LTNGLCKRISFIGMLCSFSVFINACTKDFQGEYDDPATVEIVDDRWNETDARKTAEALISSSLSKPWLATFTKTNNGERPIVLVDDIENRTAEHIDTKALTESVRNELINSGKVRFVNESRRQKILEEIKYQESGAVAASSAKKSGRQIGADYMLGGAISATVNMQGGLKVVTYQTNLILTNLETAEIEWSEKYPIKKRFRRSGVGF
jgi:penicillin-binding protein activator